MSVHLYYHDSEPGCEQGWSRCGRFTYFALFHCTHNGTTLAKYLVATCC